MTAAHSNIQADGNRLFASLDQLATYSSSPAPSVTRVVFTETDLAARAYVRSLMEDLGLTVRTDAIGNTFARWPGREPDLPGVATGSHMDALPNGGKYDGTAGVMGAIEAFRALKEAAYEPRRPLEILIFTAEEPTRFGLGCLGSRVLCGQLKAAEADALRDAEGKQLADIRRIAGFTGPLESAILPHGHYHAFVEFHIEQGPLLEREGIPIGIVTAIAAPSALRVRLEGEGGHAGTVLMPDRRDSLLAAAEIAMEVEKAALHTESPDTVATTGLLQVFPGACNSIPCQVTMEIDVRDIRRDTLDEALEHIRKAIDAAAARRRQKHSVEMINADDPAFCAPEIVEAAAASCEELSLPVKRMISRAYHDSLFMARIAPTGMIFIPCRNGVSHNPDEYASPEDLGRGATVLARTLARLAS